MEFGIGGLVIIAANVILSLRAFRDFVFYNNWTFDVGQILQNRDFKRMITSGFVHVDIIHLAFNMLSLYFFADIVESSLGIVSFFVIYFASLLGGNLLALWLNRFNPNYRAVGASGAVGGIIFAAIVMDPGMGLALYFVIPIPGWLFALGYVLVSIYGIGAKRDNIGHEAHLGGAIVGLLVALALAPQMLRINTFPIVMALVPIAVFLILMILGVDLRNIQNLRVDRPKREKKPQYFDMDDYYRDKKKRKENELNKLLEKVSSKGIDSLSAEEKRRLEELSK